MCYWVLQGLVLWSLVWHGKYIFWQGKLSREYKFERHAMKVQKGFRDFIVPTVKRSICSSFLSKVESTASIQKSCPFPFKLCCLRYSVYRVAKGIPMKPIFCPIECENERAQDACVTKCHQTLDKPLRELAANLGVSSASKTNYKRSREKRFC